MLLLTANACAPTETVGEHRRAITNGSSDTTNTAVVAIVSDDTLLCSGTLITPHTVVTAAHCVQPGLSLRVFFGESLDEGTYIETSRTAQHPGFVAGTFENDIGLLTLREAAPVAPMELDTRSLDESVVGQSFVASGYGVSSAGADDSGQRRSGTSIVASVAATELRANPAPAQACAADSGGPALFDAGGTVRVSGVVSRGDAECTVEAIYARVDVALTGFIQPYLAATAPRSAQTGETCLNDAQCVDGPCIRATDDPRIYYCSTTCTETCPADMACEQNLCVHPTPSPGAFGATCTEPGDCIDRLCYDPGSGGVCTLGCRTNPDGCPTGTTCQHAGGLSYYCLEPPPSGGCSTSSGNPTPVVAILLACLIACRRRRGAALVVAGVLGCSGGAPPPIPFVEVTGERVPEHAQIIYDPDSGNAGLGAAVGDVNGDGRPDLYLAGAGIFLNLPDPAGFRLVHSPGAGPEAYEMFAAAFGDYDRDGDLDLVVSGRGGPRLWQNDGTGRFSEVTGAANISSDPTDLSFSVAWGDINGDGWLDLAVANYGPAIHESKIEPSRLLINQRDGTFEPLLAPLSDLPVRAWVIAFTDFNGDGRLDLYVGDDADIAFSNPNIPRRDLVLINEGPDDIGEVILTEASAAYGLDTPRSTMGFAMGNPDRGPGWDVMITDIEATWLYRNTADGQPFADITAASGIDFTSPAGESWWQWGCVFSDLDGDGWEDGLVAQSGIFANQPDADRNAPVLLYNRGDSRGFDQRHHTLAASLNARALLLVDLDLDGDDDVVATPYYDRFRFFTNATTGDAFLRLRLEATVSAPGAAGATVVAATATATQKRIVVAGGQPHSTSEPAMSFGLAEATSAHVRLAWPSGAVQQLELEAGTHTVREPEWLQISDRQPVADGVSMVAVTIDTNLVGGGPNSSVQLRGGVNQDLTADDAGLVTTLLPPRAVPETVLIEMVVNERRLPLLVPIDYQ